MRVVIVGAGIAGLACADRLARAGHAVALFDKGRGPGGRMSTRRAEAGGRALSFDHGAQYFTARDPAFVSAVGGWEAAGVAARWPAAGPDAWVGTPGMNAPVRALAAAHAVTWGTRIDRLERDGAGWRTGGEPFDAAVVAVPAEQAAPLLLPHHPAFAARATAARSQPCWTAMAAFDRPLPAAINVFRDRGAIGWAACNSAKPGRGGPEAWVVQASPAWSFEHLEDGAEAVAPALLALLADELGAPLPAPVHLSAHRWRFARSGGAGGPELLWDPALRLGACGDWLLAPRVEAAWLSGRRLGERMAG